MALASASGLGRPSVARLGAADPSPPLSPRTADASARAQRRRRSARVSRHRGRARERPAFGRAARARRHRRNTEGTRGDRRRETRDLRAPEGVRLENVPVASDALPDRTHPSHRLAPDTRREITGELHGRVPQETGARCWWATRGRLRSGGTP